MIRAVLLSTTLITTSALAQTSQSRITIMTYNVENLFDNSDNPNNAGDQTYLPRSQKQTQAHKDICELLSGGYRTECLNLDWSDAVLKKKIANLAAVIGNFEGGAGPDILVMPELENMNVLKMMVEALPQKAQYQTVEIFESSRDRGINVGLISKLPKTSGKPAQFHQINFSTADSAVCKNTRDILEVNLALPDGANLVVYGLHFPSGGNPKLCRDRSFEALNAVKRAKPANEMQIALGDANVNCTLSELATLTQVAVVEWMLPDELAKGKSGTDQESCRAPGSNFFLKRNADGSFTPQWSFLDVILASRNLSPSFKNGPGWFINYGSFRTVINSAEQVEARNSQISIRRFDAATGTGVSDHLPVAVDLIRRGN